MGKLRLICMINVFFLFFYCSKLPKVDGNILLSIFYGTVMSEILRIARSSSSVALFYGKTNARIIRITWKEKQSGNRLKLIKQALKANENHSLVFQEYDLHCVKSVRIRNYSGPGKCGPEYLRIRTLFTQCCQIELF